MYLFLKVPWKWQLKVGFVRELGYLVVIVTNTFGFRIWHVRYIDWISCSNYRTYQKCWHFSFRSFKVDNARLESREVISFCYVSDHLSSQTWVLPKNSTKHLDVMNILYLQTCEPDKNCQKRDCTGQILFAMFIKPLCWNFVLCSYTGLLLYIIGCSYSV